MDVECFVCGRLHDVADTQRARPEELRLPRTRSSTTSSQGEGTGGSGGTVAGRARVSTLQPEDPCGMRERGWHLDAPELDDIAASSDAGIRDQRRPGVDMLRRN